MLEDRDGDAGDALVRMKARDSSGPVPAHPGYSFSGFHLDTGGRLSRGETVMELPDDEACVLAELVARAGHVVTHARLRSALDAGKSTRQQIALVVRRLQSRIGEAGSIEPVYKRGYRFSGDVRVLHPAASSALPRLAFVPLKPGPGVPEYLGEAVAEEAGRCLKTLAPGSIEIAEQDSVITLFQRQLAPIEIGAAMGADWVLTGSLRALAGTYRLRADLIRVSDGQTQWSEDLMVPGARLFSAGEELAGRVLMRTGAGISLAAAAEPEVGPHQQEAYDLLWHARQEWRSLQRHQMQDGLQRLRCAVAMAPLWTQPRIDLVNLCTHQAMFGFMGMREAVDLIRLTVAGAQEQGRERLLPVLGWVYLLADRNLKLAQAAFAVSAHLPHDRWVTRMRTTYLLSLHRFDEAVEMLERAIRIDPWSGGLRARLAWALHLAGKRAASLKQSQLALERCANHNLAELFGAIILARQGQADRAVEIAGALVRRCPFLDPALSVQAYALACAGRADEARAILERLKWLGRERHMLRAFTPVVFTVLGEFSQAIEELRTAERMRCPWFFQMMADPALAPLRELDGFRELAAILPALKDAAGAEREVYSRAR